MKRTPKPRTLGIASLLLLAFSYPLLASTGGLLFVIAIWFSVLFSVVAGINGSKWWFVITGMCAVTVGFFFLLGFTAK